MKRKFLSIVLSVFMVLGFVPGLTIQEAYAATTIPAFDEAGLIAAIADASAGDIIGLAQDITLSADLTVNNNVTLASAGAKIIAGSHKIIIPAGSSVSFGAALGVTGSAATGYRDGLVVVQGGLTIQPGSVSITNSYTGGGNSSTVYVDGGWLDVQGGAITDDPDELNITGNAVLLNGGYLDTTSGGSAIAITGSGCGISSGGGADVSLYTGTVSGNCGVLFSGTDGGSFYMQEGTVIGNYAGIRILDSAPVWASRIIGGTVTANNGYGVELEEFGSFLITRCDITGSEGEGGVFVESGSALEIDLDDLSIAGGIRVFDGTMDGTAFLTALPADVSVDAGDTVSFPLTGAETTFEIDGATSANLNASLSPDTHTVTLIPTLAGSQALVLTSSVDLNDEDYGGFYSNALKLTIPVAVTTAVDLPVLTNVSRTDICATKATLSAGVFSDGGGTVSEYGFVYSTSSTDLEIGKPGVTTLRSTDAGSLVAGTADEFAASLAGLSPGTGYYVRAYAINSAGTGYTSGSNSFVTAATPEVTTGQIELGEPYGLAWNQMYVYGNVISEGADSVTERGIVYTTVFGSSGPDNLIIGGTDVTKLPAPAGGAGEYRVQINDLTTNTIYYYRAYATNAEGTVYGSTRTVTVGNIVIHVDTEDGGELVIGPESAWTGAPNNTKGALFWNGSTWVSNDTAAHMYFTDLRTGERLMDYTDIAIPAKAGTQTQNGVGFAAEEYSYQAMAADGSGTYQYTGIKYTLTQADGKKIILLSRGLGRGTGASYFDVFIENETEGTLAVRQGGVLYSYAGTAAEALAADDLLSNVMGLLRTEDVYWFDREGGSDMGGVTYSVHTGEMPSALVAVPYPSRISQVERFDLMIMSSENALYRYILVPSLTGETFLPVETALTVTTNPATGITVSGATLNGGVTASGGAEVTERGFVYATSANPIAETGTKVTAALETGTGPFDATLTGLASGTTYHVRAYAIGAAGTVYGEDRVFTTRLGVESGGSGGSGTQTYNAKVKEGSVTTGTLPVTVDATAKTGTASLDGAKATTLFGAGNASVVMPSIPGVGAYTVRLPASALNARQKGGTLILSTGFGSVAIPDNMLGTLSGTDGKKAGVTAARGDTSGLTDAEKAAVGDRPLIQLTLTLDGVQTMWNNPSAPVTVTIPYTPTAKELLNPESILVWYLDGSGKPVCIPNGHYDPTIGTVTFTTNHFSRYAVGYNPVSFKDVATGAWYYKGVSFISARGITDGTGDGNYSPDAKLTRGEFIVLLMRAYGIEPDLSAKDNFTDAGNTWYTNYLAAAKRLGITNGVGDNMFAPEQSITRQEMFTLLYNALNVLGRLPGGVSGKTLADFSDASEISPWAKDAMAFLIETGIVTGSEGKLNPVDTTTRAQMGTVFLNLFTK